MMSFQPHELAQWFASSERSNQPAATARKALIDSGIVTAPERDIIRHTDRAASLAGSTIGAMTSAELGRAIEAHGFQHRP